MPKLSSIASLTGLLFLLLLPSAWGQKLPLTLDDIFNAVDIRSVQISPDGHAMVIETSRPDWTAQRFRNDLWLYRDDGGGPLVQLTQSGHDSSPQWSPDGRWIAFLSDRKTARKKLKRLLMNDEELKKFLDKFTERQLRDSAYASKLAAKYLGYLYGGVYDAERRQRIVCTSGEATAELRKAWGLYGVLGDGPTASLMAYLNKRECISEAVPGKP